MQSVSPSWLKILVVAIALGTAWAVRGQFGHEHGAAWAGGIGVLTLLLLANRSSWVARLPAIVAIGAIGWGVGGMMSYGVVVGYGRGVDWFNVSYGLCMLFVIGGLYGFIGGGLTGLALESTEENKPNWAALITQMIAGGYLIWGILIYQLEWLMTPPRSELWAACLGAVLALGWFLYRHQFHRGLTVALYSALGAGFGFAFGNFLQVLGSSSGIVFNWWNVMEYSLGFFGGLGMAYAVFAQPWPDSRIPDKSANVLGWIFLIILLPIINLIQQFSLEDMSKLAERVELANESQFATTQLGLAWGGSLVISIILILLYWLKATGNSSWSLKNIRTFLIAYLGWFIFLSNLLTGAWWGFGSLRDLLYWLNALVILILGKYALSTGSTAVLTSASNEKVVRLAMISLLLLLVLSWVLTQSHSEMPGAQTRFSLWR